MGAMLVAAALAWPSSRVAASASAPGFDPAVTGIVSPSEGQLVRGGRVSVVIRSHTSLRSMRVLLDGRSIGGRFRPAGAGTYRAVLQRGRALHDGENLLTVRSVTGDRFDFDYVPFVVARPGRRLFAVRELRVGAGDVPVRVVVGLARGVVFRARVNGRRVDGAFLAERGKLVGRLGANDGLRQGSNRIDLVAFRSSGRRASYAVFSRRFRLGRASPIAAAGPDQVATQNQLVRFDGTGSRLGRGGTRSRELIWRISAA